MQRRQLLGTSAALGALLQARGLTVYTWTVDTPERIRFVRDAGVDGIISNRPDLISADRQAP